MAGTWYCVISPMGRSHGSAATAVPMIISIRRALPGRRTRGSWRCIACVRGWLAVSPASKPRLPAVGNRWCIPSCILPGDAVDVERPVLFALDGTRRDVDTALFDNPYSLSPLQWRSDGRSVAFEYVQRGFQRMRVIAVDAISGRARVAVGERAHLRVCRPQLSPRRGWAWR